MTRGKRVEYYDLDLTVRGAMNLAFELTPHYVEFDKAGRKITDVIQGCAELVGTVSMEAKAAAQPAP